MNTRQHIPSSSNQANLDTSSQTLSRDLNFISSTPMEQLNQFLTNHADTAGARLIQQLRMHLHYQPGTENKRMDACDAVRFPHNMVRCLTGREQVGTEHKPEDTENNNANNINNDEITKKAFMPLGSNISVYEMPRYPGSDRLIPALGTLRSCLPLFLAGSVVGENKMTLELGPFFGLSSKCIVAGMQIKGVRENSFLALDTFQGIQNYMSIKNSKQNAWILEEYPSFTWNNTSFLFLWEKAVQSIYPTAQGRAGYVMANTLNPGTIGKPTHDIELISIDSAKSVEAMQNQLAGLGPIKTGTILFLLDFEYVSSQIQLVYGCLRESGFLLPVYTAWKGGEGWAFVVTKDFSFSDFVYPDCVTIESEKQNHWIEQDVKFLASLQNDVDGETIAQARIDKLTQKLYAVMEQPYKG